MKHEYHEGKQAGENFEKFARAIFQAKKTVVPPKSQPKKQAVSHSPLFTRR
jgi:hypothetical protein